ncbi:hypothetical protein J3R83DRAFT_11546 [Lanmaoa asiatica]|nr:hypothetical protein J3R83DRAFT_11546 [Lanmaoa asiatica]
MAIMTARLPQLSLMIVDLCTEAIVPSATGVMASMHSSLLSMSCSLGCYSVTQNTDSRFHSTVPSLPSA